MAALGLGCCAPAFSSCNEWGLLSSCRAWVLEHGLGSCNTQAQDWWHTGLAAWHVGSSQTKDQTHVPCIGRQILNL